MNQAFVLSGERELNSSKNKKKLAEETLSR